MPSAKILPYFIFIQLFMNLLCLCKLAESTKIIVSFFIILKH